MENIQKNGRKRGGECSKTGTAAAKKKLVKVEDGGLVGPSVVQDQLGVLVGFRINFWRNLREEDEEYHKLRKEIHDLRAEILSLIKYRDELIKRENEEFISMRNKKFEKIRNVFLEKFADVPLPTTGEKPTKDNIQAYIREVLTISKDKNHPFCKEAEKMIAAVIVTANME